MPKGTRSCLSLRELRLLPDRRQLDNHPVKTHATLSAIVVQTRFGGFMLFTSLELMDLNAGPDSRVFRVGKVLSVLYLILFALFEIYSAAATALDHSGRFPAWESNLGWCLFLLPCELIVALALLMYSGRPRLGFYLVLLNLAMYAGFMFLESVLVHDFPSDKRAIWSVFGIWASLFVIALGAAWVLVIRHRNIQASFVPE